MGFFGLIEASRVGLGWTKWYNERPGEIWWETRWDMMRDQVRYDERPDDVW